MKKQLSFFILLSVAALMISACSPASSPTVAAVETAQPETLIAEGRLMPVNSMDQSFLFAGEVAEVLVQDGERVTAGQVLARLVSPPETQVALARAQQELLATQQALDSLKASAEVALAKAKLARIAAQKTLEEAQERYDLEKSDENQALLEEASAQLKLAEDAQDSLEAAEGVDPNQRAALEARLAAAEAALTSAQAAADALELKASMDGTIVDLTLQPGQKTAAGQPVITIADFSTWVVHTDNLTEMEIVKVKVGQPVSVILDALPEQTLAGSVKQIRQRYEEKRGDITYTVEVALNQTDPQMRWGMTAAVQILP